VGGKSVSEEDAAEVFLPLAKLTQPRPHSGGACRATRFDANARRVGAPAKAHEGAKTAARDISLDDPRRGVLWRCLWALLEKICANKITARNLSFIRHHLQSGHSSASSRAHPPPPVARTAHAARTGSNMAALPIASPLAHAVRGTPLSSRRTPNGLRKAWCAPKSVRARARAVSLRASVSEPAAADTAAVVTPGGDQFDWHKAWYPMSPIDFLDPLVPNKLNLLGRAMVAWRAGDGSWSVVDDSCPHRMAPLSLGYLDDKQRLTCRYHGWAFDKQGTAVEIPMSVDGNANATACASSRSCATSFPVKVRVTRFPNPDTLLYLSAGDCCPYIAQHGTDTTFRVTLAESKPRVRKTRSGTS
jgi:nitrite reductase/ring-hydroxylating ferredoxin subunit